MGLTTCKNFIGLICVTVISFKVTAFKLGLYSLMIRSLCRNMLQESECTVIYTIRAFSSYIKRKKTG
jgi:hypothetical protein